MVCGIHVEPDTGHPHDPYTQAALHPEQSFIPADNLDILGIIVLTIIPFTELGSKLGLFPLPEGFFIYLAVCVLAYMLLATCIKKAYVRHYGELL